MALSAMAASAITTVSSDILVKFIYVGSILFLLVNKKCTKADMSMQTSEQESSISFVSPNIKANISLSSWIFLNSSRLR